MKRFLHRGDHVNRDYLVTTEADEGPLFQQPQVSVMRRGPAPEVWTVRLLTGVVLITECEPFVGMLFDDGRVLMVSGTGTSVL